MAAGSSGQPPRLKGILRLISSQYPDPIPTYEHDATMLAESQTIMQNRRRKRPNSTLLPNQMATFEELVNRHRYACFFFIQGNPSRFYSSHCLKLRKRLSEDYHDVMATFLVTVGGNAASTDATGDVFCQGTGFSSLPSTPILLSLLNINQVPVAVVLEKATGHKISRDAMLAMEWNNPQSVINAWQRGKSGLDCTQKALAVASMQSDCTLS